MKIRENSDKIILTHELSSYNDNQKKIFYIINKKLNKILNQINIFKNIKL